LSTAEKRCFAVRPYRNEKEFLKAGTVPHTSTDFWAVWKSCAAIFAAYDYSELFSERLSSAEDVTAAHTVQKFLQLGDNGVNLAGRHRERSRFSAERRISRGTAVSLVRGKTPTLVRFNFLNAAISYMAMNRPDEARSMPQRSVDVKADKLLQSS